MCSLVCFVVVVVVIFNILFVRFPCNTFSVNNCVFLSDRLPTYLVEY